MEVIMYVVGLIRGILIAFLNILLMFAAYWYVNLPVIFCLVILPHIIRFVRAIVSRMRFARRLKSLANKKGGKCDILRSPLASIFVNNSKNDIHLDIGKEKYAIKFFRGNPLNKKVYIADLTTAYVARKSAQTLKGNHGGRVNFIFNKVEEKLRRRKLKIEQTEHKTTVLVLDPPPYELYVLDKNKYSVSGSGETFEGVMLYIGDEFISFLERT